jgi:hypothetical protein
MKVVIVIINNNTNDRAKDRRDLSRNMSIPLILFLLATFHKIIKCVLSRFFSMTVYSMNWERRRALQILRILTGNPVYLISTKGAWRVWPVSRGCLLLHGAWSCLGFPRSPCKPAFHCGLFHVPDLCTEFDCGFFRLPNWTHRFWLRILPFT